jgi:hypothetical protein
LENKQNLQNKFFTKPPLEHQHRYRAYNSKNTQNSHILIRGPNFDEGGSIFDWILSWNPINTPRKSRQKGSKEEKKKIEEERILEFQVWMFKSLAQRFPQLGEKLASLGK